MNQDISTRTGSRGAASAVTEHPVGDAIAAALADMGS